MNEEDESPSGSQTADQDKKKESLWTKIIHKFGLEKRSVVDKLENELKMKSKKNELLKDELESKKSLMSEMESEIKSKDEEIKNLKANEVKSEAEWKSRMTQTEKEIKLKAYQIENLEITQTETEVKWSNRMTEKESEIKSKDEEIESLKSRISQLEGEAQSMIDNLMKTEIMIGTKFTEISKLTEEKVYSQPTEHAEITWKMGVYKNRRNRICFFLEGRKESVDEWFYPVITEFLMFSQKSKKLVHREEKLVYDATESSNMLTFISHKDLFNEENGFVKDDSILVAVAIRTHPRIVSEFTETTIHSKFTDISKLTVGEVFSQPTVHAGVTWKMSVYKEYDNDFTFCLEGKKKNDVDWVYLVNAEFRLISQKSEEIVHKKKRKLIYDAENSGYWINYISPEDLFNDENGFVKDDSIIVDLTIRGIPTD